MLESKRRALIFISISLILAVVAGFLFMQKVKDLNHDLGGTTKVYAATSDIDSRSIITPDDIEVIELPNKFFVEGSHITKPEDITNRVSVVPISEGSLLNSNSLKDYSEVGDPNNRLVALFSNEKVSFDEEVKDLDRVDIIVSHQFEDKQKTETFMTDVLVFRTSNSDGKLQGIGLEVSKDQAPELIHMQNYADSIRVLKANVGKETEEVKKEAEEAAAAEAKAAEEKAKVEEEKAAAEKAKAEEEKKKAEEEKKKENDKE